MRTCLALLVVGLLALIERGSLTTASAAGQQTIPDNIIMAEPLRELVLEMLHGSRTFRRQCERLGALRALRIQVSAVPETRWGGRLESNALCTMKRYQHGRIEADVRLLTLLDAPRLIAHELEHVREFTEGMNFLATSIQTPHRVWVTADGHYETTRAIGVGEQVAMEFARSRPRQNTATLTRRAQ